MSETPNLILELPRPQYDKLDRVNWSSLKHMAKSPLHFRHNQLEPEEDTDAKKLGRATHLACFEPEKFRRTYVMWEAKNGQRRGEKWTDFQKKWAGYEILTEREYNDALAIQRAVLGDPLAAKYLTGGRAEVTLTWEHTAPPIGGLDGYTIACKGRPDFAANLGALADLKSCVSSKPEEFAKVAWRLLYYAQAAFYVDGYKAVTGKELPFFLVAVEKRAPHPVTVLEIEKPVLDEGRELYRALMDRLHLCRSTGKWPAYSEEVVPLELPKWATNYDSEEDVTGLGIDFGDASAA